MTDKILIRGVNWIGDAVMTMPAIRALKKAYPGSKLSLLVKLFGDDSLLLEREQRRSLILNRLADFPP